MPTNEDYFLTWSELHRDTRELAKRLIDQYQGDLPWKGIIGVARGGLIPATILAREFNMRMVDSVCIASYDHTQQGSVEIIKPIAGDGTGFLLVDDLVDTGTTAKVIHDLLPKACFVTIYAKPAGRSLTEHFVREFPQDTWIHFPWDSHPTFAKPLLGT